MLHNVTVDWNGSKSVIGAPFNIRPVFSGERLVVYGLNLGDNDEVQCFNNKCMMCCDDAMSCS